MYSSAIKGNMKNVIIFSTTPPTIPCGERREENRIFTKNERKIGIDRGIGGHSKEVIHTLMASHLDDRVMRGILTHKNNKTGRRHQRGRRSQDNWLKWIWLERGLRVLWNDVFR
jgi:hypothetical protein